MLDSSSFFFSSVSATNLSSMYMAFSRSVQASRVLWSTVNLPTEMGRSPLRTCFLTLRVFLGCSASPSAASVSMAWLAVSYR